jgi:hypothetical protein
MARVPRHNFPSEISGGARPNGAPIGGGTRPKISPPTSNSARRYFTRAWNQSVVLAARAP